MMVHNAFFILPFALALLISQDIPKVTAAVMMNQNLNLPTVDVNRSAAEIAHLVSNLPQIHLMGFTKCGSTTLFVMLQKLPALLFPKRHDEDPSYYSKEVHYFDIQRRYDLGLSYYGSYFPQLKNNAVNDINTAIDATPYISKDNTIRLMSAVYAHREQTHSFIISMRDPFPAVSSYWNHLRRNPKPTDVLEDDLRALMFSKNISQCTPRASWWQHRHKSTFDSLESNFELHCPYMIRKYIYVVYLEMLLMKFPLKNANYCIYFVDEFEDNDSQHNVLESIQSCLHLPKLYKNAGPLKGSVKKNLHPYTNNSVVSKETRELVEALYQPWLCALQFSLLRQRQHGLSFNGMTAERLSKLDWIPSAEKCKR